MGNLQGLQLPATPRFKQEEPAAALEDDDTLSAQLNQAPLCFLRRDRRDCGTDSKSPTASRDF